MAHVRLSLAFGGWNVTQIVQPREFVCLAALADPDCNHHHDGRQSSPVDISGVLSSMRCTDFLQPS